MNMSVGLDIQGFTKSEDGGPLKAQMKADGVDPSVIVDALQAGVDAEKKVYEDRIVTTDKKKNALAELQLGLMEYQDKLKFMQGASAVEDQRGVFGFTKPTYGFLDGNKGSTYFTVTSDATAQPKHVDISIEKIAQRDGIKGAAKFADTEAVSGLTGTLTFPHKDGKSDAIIITLDGTETASQVSAKVNAFQDQIGVRATLIPSGNEYVLSFDALDFSKPIGFDAAITGGDTTLLPTSRSFETAATPIPDTSSSLGIQGTIIFPHKDGTSADITLTFDGTESSTTVINRINAESGDTNVEAILVGNPGSEQIRFQTLDHSAPPIFTKNITNNAALMPEPPTLTKTDLQAVVTFQGETSRHDTNALKMPDMTLNLLQQTQNTGDAAKSISIDLDYSREDIAAQTQEWIESYNALKDVVTKYSSMDINALDLSAEEKEDFKLGLLRTNAAMQDVDRFVETSIKKTVGGKNLVSFGIKPENGKLEVNMSTFKTALDNDFNSVRDFFAYSETSSNPLLSTTAHPSYIPTEFSTAGVDIEISRAADGTYSAVLRYNGDGGTGLVLDVTSTDDKFLTLEAPKASEGVTESLAKGFTFFYNGILANDTSLSSTMSFSQGLADEGIGYIKGVTDPDKGIFKFQNDALDGEVKSTTDRITRIEELGKRRIEREEKRLVQAMMVAQQLASMTKSIERTMDIEYGKN